MEERDFMLRAIELAKKGEGWVNPNPLVGAVIVRDGDIVAKGYHHRYGDLHAEREALKDLKESGHDARGCHMYVTLEPCCHHGKQPPCTDAIIESGIGKVVVGSSDPNPLVAGKGIEILRKNGIEVVTDFMKEECDSINAIFFHYIRTELPYVTMKYAMTADGKTAAYTGKSRWITGETARRRVHEDRSRYMAIMVGIGTVLSDDPMLNCRLEDEEIQHKDPVRIICDSSLQTPMNSKLVKTAVDIRTIIATCVTDSVKITPYREAGCEIIQTPKMDGHVDLRYLIEILGKNGIDSILLEGGGTLNWSAMKAGIVSSVQCYIGSKIFGGVSSYTPVGGEGIASPDEAFILKRPKICLLDEDVLIESEVSACSQG